MKMERSGFGTRWSLRLSKAKVKYTLLQEIACDDKLAHDHRFTIRILSFSPLRYSDIQLEMAEFNLTLANTFI